MMGQWMGRGSGLLAAGLFYAVVLVAPVPALERYFLGHPVAIAATVLFWMAMVQLAAKAWHVRQQQDLLGGLTDSDLLPSPSNAAPQDDLHAPPSSPHTPREEAALAPGVPLHGSAHTSPAQAASVRQLALRWLADLGQLSATARRSRLVHRIEELLDRQARRGHARGMSEDLRELSDRDGDRAHDSLQLVRIIVWAIPMLGFLGTVIGITQTLGGLDFTDGTGAVDRLKAGLYVAFDTTALGLVLSVVAIFLQFPVERSEQRLLAEIDHRAGMLLSGAFPDAHGDTAQGAPQQWLQQMADQLIGAVQQSVQTQAALWRETIEAAHLHWQQAAGAAETDLRESLRESITPALQQHAQSLRQLQREGADAIDRRWQQWQTSLSDNARILLAHQQTLVRQGELLAESHHRAAELAQLQEVLDRNLQSLDRSLESSVGAAATTDAMRTLARAVDVLATRMPLMPAEEVEGSVPRRRAA